MARYRAGREITKATFPLWRRLAHGMAVMLILLIEPASVLHAESSGHQKGSMAAVHRPRIRADDMAQEYIAIFGDGIGGQGVGDAKAGGPAKVAAAISRSKEFEDAVEGLGVPVHYRYRTALIGFSARLSRQQLKTLSIGMVQPLLPLVPSRRRTLPPNPMDRRLLGRRAIGLTPTTGRPLRIQFGLPEGLDRLDQRFKGYDGQFRYSRDGAGVHIYVIDSGIRSSHTELAGRVLTAPGDGFVGPADGVGTEDCQGHGSHVAGIIGGTSFGVAKQALMHPVRVFDCDGDTDDATVLAAVDWVTAHYLKSGRVFPAVANLSFGHLMEGGHDWLNDAVQNSISIGITYVAAAGNERKDACAYAPGRVDKVILVGNFDQRDDIIDDTSNTGSCVDIFAPGNRILSIGITDDYEAVWNSGTSMAAPHVAGVAALHLQAHPKDGPDEVWAAILGSATMPGCQGWAGLPNLPAGTNNRVLHWEPDEAGMPC